MIFTIYWIVSILASLFLILVICNSIYEKGLDNGLEEFHKDGDFSSILFAVIVISILWPLFIPIFIATFMNKIKKEGKESNDSPKKD